MELIFFHKPGADKSEYNSHKIKMNGHQHIPALNIKYEGISNLFD